MYSLRLLSKNARLGPSLAIALRAAPQIRAVRLNSTTQNQEETTSVVELEKKKEEKVSNERRLPPSLYIYLSYLCSGKGTKLALNDFVRKLQMALDKESKNPNFNSVDATKNFSISFHKIMNFLVKIHPETSPSAINYRILSVMKEFYVADISHFNKVMQLYLKDDKPEDALSLFVEALEYERSLENKTGYLSVRFKSDIYATLYVAYLKTCFVAEQTPELSVFKSISSNEKFEVNEMKFSQILSNSGFKQDFITFAHRFYKKHEQASANPNDPKFITEGLNAAMNRQISGLEKSYTQIIKSAELSGTPISEETYRKMMHMFSTGLKPQRAQLVWNMMIDKIGIPSIDSWNELLFSFSKVKSRSGEEEKKENLAKLETTFQYMDENFNVNQTTLSYLVSGYLANEEFEKAFQLVQQLSSTGRKGVKINDEIISSYLLGLLQAGKLSEATSLLDSFIESAYKPDIRVLNTFLSQLNKKKNYTKCDQIIELIHKFNLKPDVATYTMLIDIILKNSRNATSTKLDDLLAEIIVEMKQNGFNFSNSVTLTAIINGLAKEGSLTSVRLLIEYMKNNSITIPFMLYTSLVDAECRFGDLELAKQIFQDSIAEGVKPNVPYYNTIIYGCLKSNSFKDAMNFYAKLRNEKSLKPNFYTYYFLLRYLSYSRKLNENAIKGLLNDLSADIQGSNIDLGRMLPRTLKSLKNKGIQLPDNIETLMA